MMNNAMSMQRTWRVREAGPGDFDLIRELYRAVWGYNRPAAYDRWRYLASPWGTIPGALAVEGDRAIGFYPVWPASLRLARAAVPGAQLMDIMTHPDFRGQWVIVALAEAGFEIAAARGIRLLYGFPNAANCRGHVRRFGWTHAGDIPHWIRPIRPSRHPRVRVRLPAPLGLLADAAATLWPTGRIGAYDVAAVQASLSERYRPVSASLAEQVEVASVPARLSALVEDSEAVGLCRVERVPAWLAWRYASEAAQGYEWITAARAGTIRAAAVWGMRDDSWGEVHDGRAHLVELAGAEAAAREAALAHVISRASARGAWLLETVTNDPETIRSLRRAGFVAHRKAPLIVRALGDHSFAPDPFAARNWRFLGGDVDTF